MKKITAVLLAIALLVPLPACRSKQKTRYEGEFLQLFDTVTKVVAYMDSKEEFTKLVNLIRDNLKVYHELYDIYHNYDGINNIKTINDNAGKKPVKVDRRIIDMLLVARQDCENTHGRFNIALGSVLRIWHTYREAGIDDPEHAELPPMSKLKAAAKHTDIQQMVIDEKASTVYLKDPEMSLDVGGIAKGYATEQVCRIAMEHGYRSALVSVGGNVRAIGDKGIGGELWNVGIQNPDESSDRKTLLITLLKDKSVVTSGVYERYYTVNGKNYHHIIDPSTLMPATNYKAVTILCRESSKADGLSTAIFNMPFEEGLKYIESLPDTEALWIFPDGTLKYSSGFRSYVKK